MKILVNDVKTKANLWLEKQGSHLPINCPWSLARGDPPSWLDVWRKRDTWKGRKSITQVTAAVSTEPSGISTSLGLVILYAAFHSAQKMSIGKCLRGLWWKFFHSFCIDRMPNQYLVPTNKLLEVSVENIAESAGRHSNKQLSDCEENMNWLEAGP